MTGHKTQDQHGLHIGAMQDSTLVSHVLCSMDSFLLLAPSPLSGPRRELSGVRVKTWRSSWVHLNSYIALSE